MQATTISKEQRFVAKDMSRAIRKLNETLGPEAILLSSRKVEEGVEVVALPAGEKHLASSLHRQAGDRRSNLRRQSDRIAMPDDSSEVAIDETVDLATPAARLAASIGEMKGPYEQFSGFEELQRELQQVKQMLEEKVQGLESYDTIFSRPIQYRVLNRLLDLGFTLDMARPLAEGIDIDAQLASFDDGECRLTYAWSLCLDKLHANMPAAREDALSKGGMFAFVGPSGAGKTSALMKLATRWLLDHSVDDIAVISVSSEAESLHRLSAMTKIPVYLVDRKNTLADRLAQCSMRRLVLIDTSGLNQDVPQQQKDLQYLASLEKIKSFIVLPATGDHRWCKKAITDYVTPNTIGCILSNIDQVDAIGELLCTLMTQQICVHYFSDGKLLPHNIYRPTASELMLKLGEDYSSCQSSATGASLS
ncbi:MAG: hypothetical protein VX231_01945 [Pseudomonadota bacterium]|nr:hypothetical protein [Pseudomonadota bacterium]